MKDSLLKLIGEEKTLKVFEELYDCEAIFNQYDEYDGVILHDEHKLTYEIRLDNPKKYDSKTREIIMDLLEDAFIPPAPENEMPTEEEEERWENYKERIHSVQYLSNKATKLSLSTGLSTIYAAPLRMFSLFNVLSAKVDRIHECIHVSIYGVNEDNKKVFEELIEGKCKLTLRLLKSRKTGEYFFCCFNIFDSTEDQNL